jgi:hypothetical protein
MLSLISMLSTSEKARFEAIQARHAAEDKLKNILGVQRKVPPRSLAEQELLDMKLVASHHPSVSSITLAVLASQRARVEAVKAQYAAENKVDAAAAKSFLTARRFLRKMFRGKTTEHVSC